MKIWILFFLIVFVIIAESVEIFRTDFTKSSLSEAFDGARIGWGSQFVSHWDSGMGCDVTFPKGSYGGNRPVSGGFGLVTKHPVPDTQTAVFKYSVFFPFGFKFTKGGKLPGFYGGNSRCKGGNRANDCFSTRLMWRADGEGELYLYANRDAQDPVICQQPDSECNPDYGWSLSRGAFTFKTGVFTDIEQRLKMNTPGQRNGILTISINGEEKIKYTNLVFRTASYPNMKVFGLHVSTFFGGSSSPDFASPSTQVIKFKNFVLSAE